MLHHETIPKKVRQSFSTTILSKSIDCTRATRRFFSLKEAEKRSVGTRNMYRFVLAGKEIVLHLPCCSLTRDIIFQLESKFNQIHLRIQPVLQIHRRVAIAS